MSFLRSFQYMTLEELLVKQAYNQHMIKTLQEPVLTPVKEYGLKGMDETVYALGHKLVPGLRKKRISHYQHQLDLTQRELQVKDKRDVSLEYLRLVSKESNPATFNVLRSESKSLAAERLTSATTI